MNGFKVNCTMCFGEDTEIYNSNVYVNNKKIGVNLSFYCKECQWEEVFQEVRYEKEQNIETEIIKVIVNKLPNDCNSCTLHEGEYCKIKGAVIGSEWIDLYSDSRDRECPLQIN